MSRREARESDSRRHRSKYDREPSPKRYRRDGKPATERKPSNFDVDLGGRGDHDQKHRRRLQDALPLEAPLPSESKREKEAMNKDSSKKNNGLGEGTKDYSDPAVVPRSRSFFQHDERGSAGQAGRSFVGRSTTEHKSWSESKDQRGARVSSKTTHHDAQQRYEKPEARTEKDRVWSHDGYFEMEKKEMKADPPPPARKRPAFREKKVPGEAVNAEKATSEPVKLSHLDCPAVGSDRREEREVCDPRYFDRSERPSARDRVPSNRERYGAGNGNYRGRDRFSGRQGAHPSGVRVEKWKHDLFNEANRSPTPKNEEDQIAKVEALLAS